MSRAATTPPSLQQLTDEIRTQAVTDLLCVEAHTDRAKQARETAAKECIPTLAKLARRELLKAAARCSDPALAKQLRGIALRIRWAVDDIARNLARKSHGL